MEVDSIAQISNSPFQMSCQAFDPMVILPEKYNDPALMVGPGVNTSCLAPAYVYLEGSRGKRYLCDFHYVYEKDITICRTPYLWNEIENVFIDKRLEISKTFAKSHTHVTEDKSCWCGLKAYTIAINKESGHNSYFCNFHYRKTYYRFLSNNINYFDRFIVVDERDKMPYNCIEESDLLTII